MYENIKNWFRRKEYIVLVTSHKHGYYSASGLSSFPGDALKLPKNEARALRRVLANLGISSVVLEYREKKGVT